MASGGPAALVQQKQAIEAKIKMLINADLKELCKRYSKPVSGTKVLLQQRCMEILDKLVQQGDPAAFDTFRYRVYNRGLSPDAGVGRPTSSAYTLPPGMSFSLNGGTVRPPQTTLNRAGKYFKHSPFYEILDSVLQLRDLPEMPNNRNTEKSTIVLTEEVARKLKANPEFRLLLFCGQSNSLVIGNTEVAFPNQIEVKLNGDEVKHNFKGLKGKPGTTKPADITHLVRAQAGYHTHLHITYALTTRRFAYTVHFARRISIDALINQIKASKIIPWQKVLDEMNRSNADPDIAATVTHMSLNDPVSTMRIRVPVRSTVCTHNQCFDCAMFLQLQEQAPQWKCPICNKAITFSLLCVDKYFENILLNTPDSIEKVSVEPNGEWTVIKEEEDPEPNGALQMGTSYDDDGFDDLIELVDSPERGAPNGLHLRNDSSLMPSPATFSRPSMTTPPVFSREASLAQSMSSLSRSGGNKRPAGAVIDLTLSDDDEPPRQTKRTTIGNPAGNRPTTANEFRAASNANDRSSIGAVQKPFAFPSSPISHYPDAAQWGSSSSFSRPASTPLTMTNQPPSAGPSPAHALSLTMRSPNPSTSHAPPHASPTNGPRLVLPPLQTSPARQSEGLGSWRNSYAGYSMSPD